MLARSSWQAYYQACFKSKRLSLASVPASSLLPIPHVRYVSPRHLSSSKPSISAIKPALKQNNVAKEVQERKRELEQSGYNVYPRFTRNFGGAVPEVKKEVEEMYQAWEHNAKQNQLPSSEAVNSKPLALVAGRITSIRLSGKRLAFFDLEAGGETMQVSLNYAYLATGEGRASESEFQEQLRLFRRGDHITVMGHPSHTKKGETSVAARSMPDLMSPCLQRLPVRSTADVSAHDSPMDRHVDMLTSSQALNTIMLRSHVINALRCFLLLEHDFTEVQTPILAAQAGGATARSFETSAAEFPDRKLTLRIAPELWLKRLVIGGMTKIFEIGPCFRNEGLDKTHNPEFTMCEFYATYRAITHLIRMTEYLLHFIVANCDKGRYAKYMDRELANDIFPDRSRNSEPPKFNQVDFIPTLNTLMGVDLPNLASATAREEILEIFKTKQLSVPDKPTLPRLLDKLCSHFLEPHCHSPTWIINIPECLSPLSKSYIHPDAPNNQPVASRAELYIRGKEVVNCYEEENDPFEQRRKFVEQQKYAGDPDSGKIDDEVMKIDEDYLKALEWGLPPTGGWGMGIDRLVMLLTGKERITDVLTFGNLRAVTRGAERWEEKTDNASQSKS